MVLLCPIFFLIIQIPLFFSTNGISHNIRTNYQTFSLQIRKNALQNLLIYYLQAFNFSHTAISLFTLTNSARENKTRCKNEYILFIFANVFNFCKLLCQLSAAVVFQCFQLLSCAWSIERKRWIERIINVYYAFLHSRLFFRTHIFHLARHQ